MAGTAPIKLSDIAKHIPAPDEHTQREAVADLLNRHNMAFPGAQPVSFARAHLHELQTTDYFMCEKTDGIRCLMYLTQLPGDEGGVLEAQFLIDRKNDYYFVPRESIHLPQPGDFSAHHVGTLLDGELVRQTFPDGKSRLTYLIFDLLAIDNDNVTSRPFDKRLARIDQLIMKPFREFARQQHEWVEGQPFQIEMKKMEFPYAMEMMFKDKIPNLPHGNDGLIFTCRETPYVFGTDEKVLKWKPPHENTVDFRLILGDFPTAEDEDGTVFEDWEAMPPMELWVNHGAGGYEKFADLTLTTAEWDALKSLNQQIDGRIIECYRDPQISDRDVWRPKLDNEIPRFRDDKKDANYISVVKGVLGSIQDAVTEQDLISNAGVIRSAYKARAQRPGKA